MTNFQILYCALALTILCSCNRKFNKADWNHTVVEGHYDKRDPMLDDLLTNYHLKGKSLKQLRALLGSSDLMAYEAAGEIKIQMNIVTDYGWNIDPQYTKDLFLYLNKDSVVTSFNVKEHQSK